ncbi:dehydrogenase [Rothia kristinae]
MVMGLTTFLQARRDAAELGEGVWRRAHDRFRRGLDRFHQILERLPEGEVLEQTIPLANELADLLPRVRAVAAAAQAAAPSSSTDVPASRDGRWSELHRALSKAGNAVAQCAEALAMMRCGGACASGCAKADAVSRRVAAVVEQVAAAEALLPGREQPQPAAPALPAPADSAA